MSFQIVTSASNTVSKTLGAADHVIDSGSKLAEMLHDQVNIAFIESKKEVFLEANKIIKDDQLSEDQIKYLQSLYVS